jgi:hypothetical protein
LRNSIWIKSSIKDLFVPGLAFFEGHSVDLDPNIVLFVLFIDPFHSSVFFPDSCSHLPDLADQFTLPLSSSMDPLAVKDPSIGPTVLPGPMFFVVEVPPFVFASVLPKVFALTVHLAVEPLPNVAPP